MLTINENLRNSYGYMFGINEEHISQGLGES